MSRAITEEEFKAWRSDFVTQEIMRALERRRDTLRRQWEGGSFTDYTKEATVLVNVANMGTCRGYAYVMELDYEDYLMEIEDDGEQKRTEATGSGSADQGV